MSPCRGKLSSNSLILPYEQKNKNINLKKILLKNFDQFFSYLSSLGFIINHYEVTKNMQNNSTTKLQFPITCFKVDFNDSFVTITAIKKK